MRLADITAELKRRTELLPRYTERQLEAISTIEAMRGEGHTVPKLLYGGAMGGGKSFFGCRRFVELAEDHPGFRAYLCRAESVSFKRTTLQTMLDPEEGVGILFRPGWQHRITEQCFIHENGSRLDYGGLATNEDREKIKSMNITAAFVDEASEVEQVSAKLLEARCSRQAAFVEIAFALYATNPEPCWLYTDFIENPKSGRAFVQALPSDNPYLAEGYEDHLTETYEDMPELLAAYLRGDWNAVSGVDKVFGAQLLHRARRAGADGAGETGTRQWGVDVARFGDDKNTVYERIGTLPATKLAEWAKQDTRTTSDKIAALFMARPACDRPESVCVDDSGVGGGVTDNLKRDCPAMNVIPVNSGESALEPDKFVNKRAEMHWRLRVVLENGGTLPDDPALASQLAAPSWKLQSGRILVEPKDAIKKRLGRSPDDADALLLAYAPSPPAFVMSL